MGDRHANADVLKIAVNEIADDVNAHVQRHRRHAIGLVPAKDVGRAPANGIAEQHALARYFAPFQVPLAGENARGTRIELILTGVATILDEEPFLAARLPIRRREGIRRDIRAVHASACRSRAMLIIASRIRSENQSGAGPPVPHVGNAADPSHKRRPSVLDLALAALAEQLPDRLD